MSKLSRRDLLKVMGATAPALLFPQLASLAKQSDSSKPNIIILLFDAMTASNLSVYGYPRPTTPNLERFAEHAIVYHNHSASANFTIPATSSILTGTYPWTHRAVNYHGMVHQNMLEKNIFNMVGTEYHRLAFPQNLWSDLITSQFKNDIDTLLSSGTYGSLNYLKGENFPKDINMAIRSLDDFVFKENEHASLFLAPLLNAIYFRSVSRLSKEGYPRGLPNAEFYPLYFTLEDLFNGLAALVLDLQSTFAYIHLYPPHAPYRASRKFYGTFNDNFKFINKPEHPLAGHISNVRHSSARRSYDEYIASIDWELGNLLEKFKQGGILENSYIIITSDHGEMFERGEIGHSTPLLYSPLVHIPLLISTPSPKTRRDVFAPTNAVDLLPTIAKLTGNPIPDWAEGVPLPELGGVEDMKRSNFSVEAKQISSFGPLHKATVSLQQGIHKMIYYTGYFEEDVFELYDIESDKEELEDLFPSQPAIAKILKEELLDKFSDVNKPYIK